MQFLLLAAAAATVASGGNAFNLTCTGTLQVIVPYLLRNTTESYETTYRIDLDAKKWCAEDCRAQLDIVDVTPIAIVLEEKDVDTPREHEKIHGQISRETGAQSIFAESGIGALHSSMFWRGQCEKAPFTGFPKVETKF